MHAFDFILALFSFVYAAAVTHVLSTASEIIIASKRIRLSCFNAGGMLVALLFTCVVDRPVGFARGNILGHLVDRVLFLDGRGHLSYARLAAHSGKRRDRSVAFSFREGRKYLVAYTILGVITMVANAVLGQAAGVSQWPAQNIGPSRTGVWSLR